MVIQRNWKIASNTTENCNANNSSSSSDDSNSSWKTNSTSSTAPKSTAAATATMGGSSVNTVTTVTATVKTHISNPQMAESVHRALKNRLNGRSHINQTNEEAAVRSMELMRINIQEVFNQEIDAIVTKYVESFFKPALNNIKENLGDCSIPDDVIPKISCALLDNSKLQYGFQSPTTMSTIKTEPFFDAPESITKPSAFKRKLHDDSTASIHHQEYSSAPKVTPVQRPAALNRTKQVYWNVSQLNADTRFVLDFKANRALGFSETSKERLASKHPELIRYLPDTVDKEWMFQQQIISAANKNNRFLLLVHGEVLKVARSDAYKSTAKFNELDSFRIPEFMLQKMKIFFTELSLRSQSFVVQPATTSAPQLSSGFSPTVVNSSLASSSSTSLATGHFSGGQSMTTTPSRNRMSSLSSSHATLSALLSSGGTADRMTSGNSKNKLLALMTGKDISGGSSSSVIKKESI